MNALLYAAVAGMVSAQSPHVLVGLYNVSTWSDCGGGQSSTPSATYNSSSGFVYRIGADHRLSLVGRFPLGLNVSWITHHAQSNIFYALSEVCEYLGKSSGSIAAFRQDADGVFHLLNRVSTMGGGPAHAALDSTGKHLLVANYNAGSVTVYPLQSDGKIGAVSAHEATGETTHQIGVFHQFIFTPVLNQDLILQWTLAADGVLKPNPAGKSASMPQHSGPRHIAFHPSGKAAYIANEGNGQSTATLSVASLSTDGVLKFVKQVKALNPAVEEAVFPAEITVSHDGLFVYMTTRDATQAARDAISVFRINHADPLDVTLIETSHTQHYPRSFTISQDPAQSVVVVANQFSNTLSTYTRNRTTGLLSPLTSSTQRLPDSPAFITFF